MNGPADPFALYNFMQSKEINICQPITELDTGTEPFYPKAADIYDHMPVAKVRQRNIYFSISA